MGTMLRGFLALAFLAGTAQVSLAKCGDAPGDDAAVTAARAGAEALCNCAGSTNHGQYVKCVAAEAKRRSDLDSSDPDHLPKNCAGAVKKCAAKSICGKPGFVTCCITKNAVTKCKLKKDETHCTDKNGVVGGSLQSGCTSCCDACPAPGDGPSCAASPNGAFLD